jgi:hypothetical protein
MCTAATTIVSVKITPVFRTDLTAQTEPGTLWRRIIRFLSPRWRGQVSWTDVVAMRSTCEHLGARSITVEHSGKDIFFGNVAGAPGNHSYYLSSNDCQNLCILFVFSSMYLCIDIATYLHTVYLDRQHVVIESNARCPWRWRSGELRDTLRGCDWASLAMQLVSVMECGQRFTGRPWSSEIVDAIRAVIDLV